mmetsp:Transcript_9577/g.18672  ORF Transcript_9577/g.18672 Transcript_9577/m.18672 type:complete len:163 (-) Transcript_9577:1280-1768(-)
MATSCPFKYLELPEISRGVSYKFVRRPVTSFYKPCQTPTMSPKKSKHPDLSPKHVVAKVDLKLRNYTKTSIPPKAASSFEESFVQRFKTRTYRLRTLSRHNATREVDGKFRESLILLKASVGATRKRPEKRQESIASKAPVEEYFGIIDEDWRLMPRYQDDY